MIHRLEIKYVLLIHILVQQSVFMAQQLHIMEVKMPAMLVIQIDIMTKFQL